MALYKSAYADFQVLARGEAIFYHPVTGVEISRSKGLTAEFGEHGGTFNSENPMTGQLEEHALIYGHFFDSEAAQQRNNWSDEERESVELAIEKIAREQPFLVMKIEFEAIPASKPWPTYDEMNADGVLEWASRLGLVAEALAYEQENKGRKVLIAQLEETLARQSADVAGSAPEQHEAITL